MFENPTVIVITGPTASGKSALAIDLAQRMDAEIISADSMQVYRKLYIGTAKPGPDEQAAVPHHLLDIRDVWARFTVAEYLKLARQAIRDVHSRGKRAVVCGGTGLYIKALVEGLVFDEDEEDLSIRHELHRRMVEEGRQALYDELSNLDQTVAKSVHPNNEKRVIRALEIIYQTGQKASVYREAASAFENEFNFQVFMPGYERSVLYERINCRVDQMIETGLIEEARFVMGLNLEPDATCLQAIGYKELFPYLRGETSLVESVEKLKMATRRYAKRQLTWFRPLDWIQVIDVDQLTTSQVGVRIHEQII